MFPLLLLLALPSSFAEEPQVMLDDDPLHDEVLPLLEQGDLRGAEAVAREALGRRQAEDPDSLAVSLAEVLLARSLRPQGQLDGPETLLTHAVRVQEDALGPDALRGAYTLVSLALVHLDLGQTQQAIDELTRVLSIQEATIGTEHSDTASTLSSLGTALDQAGRVTEAEAAHQRALEIEEGLNGPESPELLATLNNLGQFLGQEGEPERGLVYSRRALAIARANLPRVHPFTATAHGNLGVVLQHAGHHAEAREHFEEALAITAEALGPDHPTTANVRNNLALLLRDLGGREDAYREMASVLEVVRAQYGEDHFLTALVMGNLGSLAHDLDRLDEATALHEAALQVGRAALGPDHPDLAYTLGHLASLARERGEPEQALALEEQALALVQGAEGMDSARRLATRHGAHALILLDLERPVEAEHAARQALALREPVLGVEHPELSANHSALAKALWDQDRREEALVHQRRAVAIDQRSLEAVLGVISPRERRQLVQNRRWRAAQLLAYLPEDAARESLSVVLGIQGLASRVHDAPPSPELSRVRRRIAEAVFAEQPPEPAALEALIAERDALERQAGAEVGITPSLEALSYGLGADEPELLALVLTDYCEPARIVLDQPRIRARVSQRRTGAQVDEALSRLVWEPLRPHLDGVDKLWVVPDGPLATVSLGALSDGDAPVLATHTVRYLDQAGALLATPGPVGEGALVVGAPDLSAVPRGGRCELSSLGPLPGTAREAKHVTRRLRRRGAVLTLMGSQASDSRVAEAAPGLGIVHLASHGFFADSCTEGLGRAPLSRSGLLLAADEHSDGIWTAGELQGVDLSSAELVVLSACDTGLGDLVPGEGVLGLRHALSRAGARTVVMSLDRVEDEATRKLMERFHALLARRLSVDEALRTARLEALRRDPDARAWKSFVVAGPG